MTAGIVISYILLVILLLLEKFWMLPVLDVRADMLASGKPVQPTSLHDYFIYAEVGKLILIVGGILLQLKNNNGKYRKNVGTLAFGKIGKKCFAPEEKI